ncbi:MAG TPA: helix-turn-helix domain-containing protein [Parvibaculum sp.]|jgi:AraC-like DNA-binding protein
MTVYLPDQAARLERFTHSKSPSSLFRTSTLPPPERFAAWRESMGVFLSSSLAPEADMEAFRGEVEGYLIDDILFGRVLASGQKYDRGSAKIARDALDHYMIQVFLDGACEMNVHGRVLQSRPGQAIAFDLGEVLDSVNSDFDLLCLIIPRARLAPLLSFPDGLHGGMPVMESGSGQLLAAFLSSLYISAPSLGPAEARAAARALLEMTAAAFNGATVHEAVASSGGQEALLIHAQSFIRRNLAAADLSPEMIAHALGISRASLYRAFEPVGGVAAYARELRLRKCAADIIAVRNAGRQLSEIAHKWGFTDAPHFTRLFKQRFGQTPGEVRHTMAPFARRDRTELDPRVGDRRYEEWIAALA